MPTDPQAAEYRRRAAELRRLAARLDDTPAAHAAPLGRARTRGPARGSRSAGPQLAVDQARIRAAADELRDRGLAPRAPGRGARRRAPSPPPRQSCADMAGHVVRYDPERVAVLQPASPRRSRRAGQRSPATIRPRPAAVGVAAGVRARLEQQWLPLLARVVADDAMATWTPTARRRPRRPVVGAAVAVRHAARERTLGRALADTAEDVIDDGDVDDIVDLAAALERVARRRRRRCGRSSPSSAATASPSC